nr:Mut7-C ubiquitin/RNAse domain-containing protein [Pontibacter liquoris]
MHHTASFFFHGPLQDFLSRSKKGSWQSYAFTGLPAVKDAIEAQGVPHPEVNVLLVNGAPVPLLHPLAACDWVEVYPAGSSYNLPESWSLRASRPPTTAFVLDVHLGKLARALRLLGFDTCYENDYSDQAIAQLASEQNRIVLTRDVGLLKQKNITWGYWLRSQHLQEQLTEVISYFNLAPAFRPFARCLACNGLIEQVAKERIADQLPPKTKLYFEEFFQCSSCQQVYWKGSHYAHMQAFISRLARPL